MSVTINAKGTSVSSFTVGRSGTIITQGGVISPPAATDLKISLDVGKDLIIDDGGSGSALITTTNSRDLYINPATGGGQYLVLCANTWPATDGTNGQTLVTNGAGILSWATGGGGGGSGTVTNLSVVSANGFAGSVATSTTTPAITLSTTVTGMVKGNGTSLVPATVGADYSIGTAAMASGILRSSTGTGNLSIATAGDFPTLNQDTTGTAAGLSSTLLISSGGTGAITANAAFNNLVPSQVTNNGKVLTTNGTNTSWTSTLSSLTVSGITSINGIGATYSATLTTSTTGAGQIVDASLAIASYRSVKYQISITSGSAYEYTEVVLLQDGTNVYMTENGTLLSGSSLATFTAAISGGNLQLLTTPANAVTVYKVVAIAIAA